MAGFSLCRVGGMELNRQATPMPADSSGGRRADRAGSGKKFVARVPARHIRCRALRSNAGRDPAAAGTLLARSARAEEFPCRTCERSNGAR